MVSLLAFALAGNAVVLASQKWQTPDWIPGLIDTNGEQKPYFIADPGGTIHVFHSQWVGGSYGIVYSHWSVGVGWTEPVDIILLPVAQARIRGAFLDNAGYVSLIFWGGDQNGADIYFTRAPAAEAGRTTAWSTPVLVGRNAITPTTAAMVSDGDGNFVVVYSGDDEGNGLYSVISHDGGNTWSNPFPFYFTSSDTLWPTALQLYRASNSEVHAVWALGDETGNSRSVHYSRLEQIDGDWTAPVVLAEAIRYEADTPSIIEYDDSLMVIYHNGFPTTRWMIRSFDDGNTWSPATRLFELVGSNGAAALVVDSSNTLHMFFGNRTSDQPPIHGFWHSVWLKDGWSVPQPVVSGPQILVGRNNEEGFDPSEAQAIVSRGNLLLVVWRHDPMAGPIHIWYSYAVLDAPELPAKILPGMVIQPTPTVETSASPTPTARAQSTPFPDVPPQTEVNNLNRVIAIGIAPTVLFIVFVIVFRKNKR